MRRNGDGDGDGGGREERERKRRLDKSLSMLSIWEKHPRFLNRAEMFVYRADPGCFDCSVAPPRGCGRCCMARQIKNVDLVSSLPWGF